MSKARDIADLLDSAGKVTADDLDVGAIGGRRNLIINGGFDVWQRGTSQTTTGYGSVDRFSFNSASMSSVNKGSDIANGFKNVLEVTLKETTNWQFPTRYSLEANTLVAGKTYTLSYYGKASQNVTGMNGHFHTSTAGQVKSGLSTEFTTEWVRYSHTFTIPSSYGGEPFVMYLLNHNKTGLGGVTFYLAEIQLELGSVATPFEHRSYGEELALCQRYYWRTADASSGNVYLGTGGANSWGSRYCDLHGRAEMRATPTIGLVGDIGHFRSVRWGGGWDTATSWGVHLNSPQTTNLVIVTGVAYANGYATGLQATNTSFFYADAEL